MPMLEVPGTFTMLVPEGWAATRSDRTYELTRNGDDGAAHLSVYDRNGSKLRVDEAERIVSRFIANTGTTESPEITVLRETSSQERAVARFASELEGTIYGWLVFLVLWRDRFVLCSCNASPGSAMLQEAEQMFATIVPARPKKGFFGRRR